MKKNIQSAILKTAIHIPDIYMGKLAYLVSLLEQIKRYGQPHLNQWLEIEKLETLLDLPEIADREWSKENPAYQQIFLDFLNIHTSIYETAIRLLKENTNS